MNKIISTFFALMLSNLAFASCSVEQEEAEIEMKILFEKEKSNSAGDHDAMDLVKVEVPISVSGVPLVSMLLTEGEVASFWIPVSFKKVEDKAIFQFPAYREAVKNFEVVAHYESGTCVRSIQRLLG
ncbi:MULTISPECIES: hypothetical protein [unclassified Microbulbifer]|uniref:hypothetical protein n=1 Tax=unclassified Microbulbifer TaxID=2619833 RepID=UPI0027E51593|nr:MULTISPECIES: hypothetical protein [unclassified Microbulbifer]